MTAVHFQTIIFGKSVFDSMSVMEMVIEFANIFNQQFLLHRIRGNSDTFTNVCMYVCMYVHVYVHVHIYICVYVCVLYVCTYILYIYIYIYICTYVHNVYTFICICTCMHLFMHCSLRFHKLDYYDRNNNNYHIYKMIFLVLKYALHIQVWTSPNNNSLDQLLNVLSN